MRNTHHRTWNIAKNSEKHDKKTEKRVNETQTFFDLEYGGKHSKTWNIRNAHCRTWNMARKLKLMGNEKHSL
jgi:hypothetical protein